MKVVVAKECNKCGTLKPGSEFGIRRTSSPELRTQCKQCVTVAKRAHRDRQDDPDWVAAQDALREDRARLERGGHKRCVRCAEAKPLTEFSLKSKSRDGRLGHCRECSRAEQVAKVASIDPTAFMACRKCLVVKQASEFHARRAQCRTCIADMRRQQWRADNSFLEPIKYVPGSELTCDSCSRTLPHEAFGQTRAGRVKRTCGECRHPESKRCSNCKLVLPASNFNVCRPNRSGLQGRCKPCEVAHRQRLRDRDPNHYQNWWLTTAYGITVQERDDLAAAQGGRCARPRCGRVFTDKKPYVDHCHLSGAIRGVLCPGCNSAFGKFGDTLAGVISAVFYLARFELGGTVDDWMPKIQAILREIELELP